MHHRTPPKRHTRITLHTKENHKLINGPPYSQNFPITTTALEQNNKPPGNPSLPPSLSPTHPHLQQQQETWTCHLEQSAQAVPDFVALWTPPYLARKRHSTGRGATHKFPTNLQHRNTHRNKQPPKMQAEK
jgi:hypothetical protein